MSVEQRQHWCAWLFGRALSKGSKQEKLYRAHKLVQSLSAYDEDWAKHFIRSLETSK